MGFISNYYHKNFNITNKQINNNSTRFNNSGEFNPMIYSFLFLTIRRVTSFVNRTEHSCMQTFMQNTTGATNGIMKFRALEEEERISAYARDAHDTKLFVFLLQAAVVTPVFFSFVFFFFFILHHAYDSRGLTV